MIFNMKPTMGHMGGSCLRPSPPNSPTWKIFLRRCSACQYGIQPTSSWGLIWRPKPGQQQWWHVIALEEASCCNLKRGLKVASLRHWDCLSTATWMSLGTNPLAVVRSLGLVAQDSILIAVPGKPPSQTSSASLTYRHHTFTKGLLLSTTF